MERFFIEGGTPLKGEVNIGGAKNAALGLIPATILCEGLCKIENIPNIKDVNRFINILGKLGIKTTHVNELPEFSIA